jgi:DNA polymerase IIIc chi subunit
MKINVYLIEGIDYYSVACKVIAKILLESKQKLHLLAESSELAIFNDKLWTFSQLEFITHAMFDDEKDIKDKSEIILCEQKYLNNLEDVKNIIILDDMFEIKNVENLFLIFKEKEKILINKNELPIDVNCFKYSLGKWQKVRLTDL